MTPVLDFLRDGLRHRKWVKPAFVCGVNGCCEGRVVTEETSHGIGVERWVYAVGDDPYAVSMTVSTGRYLPEAEQEDQPPEAWDMSSHRRVKGGQPGCLCISDAPCSSDGTSLGASEWYEEARRHGEVTDDAVFTFLRTDLYPAWAEKER